MARTASDILVDVLVDLGGDDTVFGIPGDGIIEALCRRKDEIRFIQARHEEAAAFAACGYAKFTGRLGLPEHVYDLQPIGLAATMFAATMFKDRAREII